MGRKKNYDRDSLIVKAMDIFYEHGYAGTSTQMLVDGLGVNRFSLYAEFGNKQKLFDVVLDYYNNQILQLNFGPLETSTAGMQEILDMFEMYRSDQADGRGCLLCNTAIGFGSQDPSGAAFVQRYFERLTNAFLNALTNAKHKGELHGSVAVKEEADYLTASTLGLFVMMRGNAPKTIKNSAIDSAIRHVEGLLA